MVCNLYRRKIRYVGLLLRLSQPFMNSVALQGLCLTCIFFFFKFTKKHWFRPSLNPWPLSPCKCDLSSGVEWYLSTLQSVNLNTGKKSNSCFRLRHFARSQMGVCVCRLSPLVSSLSNLLISICWVVCRLLCNLTIWRFSLRLNVCKTIDSTVMPWSENL